MMKSAFSFFLLVFLPLSAYARWSLDITGWLYIGLGIIGVFLLYRFWIIIFALPAMILYLIVKLVDKEVDESTIKITGVGFFITLAFPIAFLPKEYVSLPWYIIALICLGINIFIWTLITLLLEKYRRSLEQKKD